MCAVLFFHMAKVDKIDMNYKKLNKNTEGYQPQGSFLKKNQFYFVDILRKIYLCTAFRKSMFLEKYFMRVWRNW
jgi:hypothetical protein